MSFEKHGKIITGETPAIDVPGRKCAGVDARGEPVVELEIVEPNRKIRGKTADAIIIDEDLEFPED